MSQQSFYDLPLKDIQHDKLGVTSFVQRISAIILQHPLQESFVIGLYGE